MLVRCLLCSTVKAGVDFQSDESITRKARSPTWISNFQYIQKWSINILSKQQVWTVTFSKGEIFLDHVFTSSLETTNKNVF